MESGPQVTASPPETGEIPTPAPTNPWIEDDEEYFVPQLLPFDAIRPIYSPRFTTADEALMLPEELVMGVAFGDGAKAYPVTVLRFREMVNDELDGIPILVTW